MSFGPTRRNDPCPCGSGKKFKRCCLPATEPGFRATLIHDGEARQKEKRRVMREALVEPERVERWREDVEREAMSVLYEIWRAA